MTKKPINIRIDGELWAQVQAIAERGGRTATSVVEEGLRWVVRPEAWEKRPAAYHDEGSPSARARRLVASGGRQTTAAPQDIQTLPPQGPLTTRFGRRCPMPGCDFRAGSPKARCPHHNKQVVA